MMGEINKASRLFFWEFSCPVLKKSSPSLISDLFGGGRSQLDLAMRFDSDLSFSKKVFSADPTGTREGRAAGRCQRGSRGRGFLKLPTERPRGAAPPEGPVSGGFENVCENS